MIKLSTMELLRFVFLFLLISITSMFCFPSRPLNERSTELTWQAWILVDDQNQNKQYDAESLTRRRITPKSVFIAPTFSPESLPPCADGYRPDSMGRCIKIIKLDEEAHLEFLLQKLNEKFGDYDDMDEEAPEDIPTAGPFQLNIPLDESLPEKTKDDSDDSVDMAIVVAPTNGNFNLDDNFKTNVKRKDPQKNDETPVNNRKNPGPSGPQNVVTVMTRFTIKNTQDEPQELTTLLSEGAETTTTEGATTLGLNEEPSTLPTTTESTTPTDSTSQTEPTTQDPLALFFRGSLNNTSHVQNGTNNVRDTPTITVGNDASAITAPIKANDSLTTDLSKPTFDGDTSSADTPDTGVKDAQKPLFKEPILAETPVDTDDLMTSDDTRQSASFVQFPEDLTLPDNYFAKFPENQPLPNVNYANQFQYAETEREPGPETSTDGSQTSTSSANFDALFSDFVNSRAPDLTANERFIFKNRDPVADTSFQGSLGLDPQRPDHKLQDSFDRLQLNGGEYGSNNYRVYNHRSRDKWSLPPTWTTDSSRNKPIVLRFSKRNGHSRQISENFYQPSTQAYYRELPPEDLSYIFGRNNRSTRRNRR